MEDKEDFLPSLWKGANCLLFCIFCVLLAVDLIYSEIMLSKVWLNVIYLEDCISNGFWAAYFATEVFANTSFDIKLLLYRFCFLFSLFLLGLVFFFFLSVIAWFQSPPLILKLLIEDSPFLSKRMYSRLISSTWQFFPKPVMLNLITNLKTTTKKKHCIWMLLITNHAYRNTCTRNSFMLCIRVLAV